MDEDGLFEEDVRMQNVRSLTRTTGGSRIYIYEINCLNPGGTVMGQYIASSVREEIITVSLRRYIPIRYTVEGQ